MVRGSTAIRRQAGALRVKNETGRLLLLRTGYCAPAFWIRQTSINFTTRRPKKPRLPWSSRWREPRRTPEDIHRFTYAPSP